MPTAFFKVVGSRIRLFTLAVMIEVGRSNDREEDTPGEAFRAIDVLARQKKGERGVQIVTSATCVDQAWNMLTWRNSPDTQKAFGVAGSVAAQK